MPQLPPIGYVLGEEAVEEAGNSAQEKSAYPTQEETPVAEATTPYQRYDGFALVCSFANGYLPVA